MFLLPFSCFLIDFDMVDDFRLTILFTGVELIGHVNISEDGPAIVSIVSLQSLLKSIILVVLVEFILSESVNAEVCDTDASLEIFFSGISSPTLVSFESLTENDSDFSEVCC